MAIKTFEYSMFTVRTEELYNKHSFEELKRMMIEIGFHWDWYMCDKSRRSEDYVKVDMCMCLASDQLEKEGIDSSSRVLVSKEV